MKTAGLYIGTTGCKLTVFDETGRELSKAYGNYPVKRDIGEPGYSGVRIYRPKRI